MAPFYLLNTALHSRSDFLRMKYDTDNHGKRQSELEGYSRDNRFYKWVDRSTGILPRLIRIIRVKMKKKGMVL